MSTEQITPEISAPVGRRKDFRRLYHKLEVTLAQIERIDDVSEMLERILESLLERFENELGFEGGRIYEREGDVFYLRFGFGKSRNAPIGVSIPQDYAPRLRVLSEGIVIIGPGAPGRNERFEELVGVSSTFAAIAVGEGNTHIIAFSISGEVKEEEIFYSLTAVRHVLNLKLHQERVMGMLEESRDIQESMLPLTAPVFEGYDINGRSRPAEIVGGDLYDYILLPNGLLGLAIADSSGHGLPAALLARDVITGIRVMAGQTSQISHTIERLNKVIHRAALKSKFVSLFYGELRRNGKFVYCNAGHNPPLLLHKQTFVELDQGGTVLGPISGARYESAAVQVKTGDAIIMYTDGVTERENQLGEPFGLSRLQRLVLELGDASSKQIVDAILAAVDEHGGITPMSDDVTVVVLRKVGTAPGRRKKRTRGESGQIEVDLSSEPSA